MEKEKSHEDPKPKRNGISFSLASKPIANPQKTLSQVLRDLIEEPRPVAFQSIRAAGYGVAIGNDLFKFKNHDFMTDDPFTVEKLMLSDRYGFDYFTLDAELRKAVR